MKRVILFAAILTAASASAQPATPSLGDPAVVDRILQVGKNENRVMNTLRGLTNIGPRLTGSPKLLKAQNWAMSQFRRYGLKNVHLEKWGDVPVGFERGDRQIGRMISPFPSDFQFTTFCWTPGTKGAIRAEAVMAPADAATAKTQASALKGKWIVVKAPAGMRGPALNAELRTALTEIGVAGVIYGSTDERVHSSGSWRGKSFTERPD